MSGRDAAAAASDRAAPALQEGNGDDRGDSTGMQSYFGFVRLSPAHRWRRIDIWLVSRESAPYAVCSRVLAFAAAFVLAFAAAFVLAFAAAFVLVFAAAFVASAGAPRGAAQAPHRRRGGAHAAGETLSQVMQFTGSAHFNRSLRHLANRFECMLRSLRHLANRFECMLRSPVRALGAAPAPRSHRGRDKGPQRC